MARVDAIVQCAMGFTRTIVHGPCDIYIWGAHTETTDCMIEIMDGTSIPESELGFSASRSGGPGGQNVNKVSSKVTLTFDVQASTALSEDQKRKIMGKLATRINK